MKSWQTDLIAVLLIVAGVLPWVLGGDGVPSIIGPSEGPRAVVSIAESGNASPSRDAVLAELRSTNWGKSTYRQYDPDHAAAKTFTDAYPGDGFHIGTLNSDGKLDELLYSGELPKSKAEAIELWKEHRGE